MAGIPSRVRTQQFVYNPGGFPDSRYRLANGNRHTAQGGGTAEEGVKVCGPFMHIEDVKREGKAELCQTAIRLLAGWWSRISCVSR